LIASLQGRIAAKDDHSVIVEVGGVGFRVFVTALCLENTEGVGHETSLFTHLHVRENELSLYGFATPNELQLFELLLGLSGIGPKSALKILSSVSVEVLQDLVSRGDTVALTRIPGVGKRTADRLMLYLKDKLGMPAEFASYPAFSHADGEVMAALTSLGYSVMEAQAAVRSLPKDPLPLEERIRMALQYFARE
jgi:holliday junction DNA helicase RuvA